MDVSRRRVLTAAAAALPALAVAPKAHAWQAVKSPDVKGDPLAPATGTWAVLEHVTDGTDPSTATVADPHFTPAIRKLAGAEVTLTGYLQPVGSGFGKTQDYLLSRQTFHCPWCYALGRGSLALASLDGHAAPDPAKPVTVRGTLALQEKDPADFYFQLKNAKLV